MALNPAFVHELSLLMQFDLSSTQQGLKVHSDAAPETVAAAARLFELGLTDHVDGGYLTPQGHEAAEALHMVRRKLGR
ncbi:TIGR02647 family protein [Simiduia agarivorans]|uniref:DNA-binding protein n=1 Tax=Simiduia agarivorans (strain DSM 21679 / JCM 13881 / BCRC 17597 / SA1) TaxID=1117647 RepID=K4KMC6_SIMAS|nr:TIGR02647 family protein [Simiduia agarivorans]AFV00152.1 DNA-binding protein [Simiduia agarivorans SA1 = DSM 21679]